jgi:predicted permease
MADLRYALRVLRLAPGFALLAILTTALGTGAVTALFGVAYGVLLRPLPWHESDRLVRVIESRQGNRPRIRGTLSNVAFNAWYSEASTIEAIGGWRNVPTTVVMGNGEPIRLLTAAVTPSLFRVLRAQPLHGRAFVEDDGRPGGSFPSKDLVILSHGFWQERFGADDRAIGSVMTLSGRPHTIVGVMRQDFAFPDRATRAWTPWAVPSLLSEGAKPVQRLTIFSGIARLRLGFTPAQAAAEGTARTRQGPDPGLTAVALFGGNGVAEVAAVPALEMMTADVKPALVLMLAAVILLLVASVANVAGLQLARSTTRQREMAIRAAAGAGVARLTRQLLVESLVIGVLGGTAGLAFAIALTRVWPALLPADFPRVDSIAVDARVLTFSILVALTSGVACSLLPAFHARRLDLVRALAETSSASSAGVGRLSTTRVRAVIMTAQIAVACVLLIGGALLTRSFVALLSSDRGYDPRNLLTARLPVPPDFPVARRTELLDTMVGRFRSMPGVIEAAYGNALPLVSAGGFRGFRMRPPIDPSAEVEVNVMQRVVSPGYFRALGLRLITGRTFTDDDSVASQNVIVVNRSFASLYLGAHPLAAVVPNLGMCRGDDDRWEVVGVVDDMRQGSVTEAAQPEIFLPYAQVGCAAAVADPIIVIRSSDDPSIYAGTLREALRELAPTLAFDSIMTMDERVMTALARPRLYAVVVAGFAMFALAISAVGLFGVLSYNVSQRAREIGIRTALGARPRSIVALVVRQAAGVAACGIAAGSWLAFASARWIQTLLFGVDAHDPVSFAVVPTILVLVAAAASVVPAVRAARLDPVRVLRAG